MLLELLGARVPFEQGDIVVHRAEVRFGDDGITDVGNAVDAGGGRKRLVRGCADVSRGGRKDEHR